MNDRLAVWRHKGAKSGKKAIFTCKSERPLSGLETVGPPPLYSRYVRLAKVNDRLAVWRRCPTLPSSSFFPPCKSERPLSGLETFYSVAPFQPLLCCKSERPLSGLETIKHKPHPLGYFQSCKSERPLSGLETKEIERHVERHVGAPHNLLGGV